MALTSLLYAEFEAIPCSPEMERVSRLKKMADKFEASTNAVKEAQDQELLDFTARRLMEMAADIHHVSPADSGCKQIFRTVL